MHNKIQELKDFHLKIFRNAVVVGHYNIRCNNDTVSRGAPSS